MKKLFIIITAVALLILAGSSAHAAWPFADDGWDSYVLPVIGGEGKFSILIQGRLTTTDFDELHQGFGVIGEYDDGSILFEDRSISEVDSVLVFGDSIIGAAGKFLENELTPDLSFRIECLAGPGVLSSDRFYLCEMRNAEDLCVCNEAACGVDPDPDPDPDPNNPDPTDPMSHTQDTDGDGWMNATETLCGSDYLVATSVPDDHDNDGICDVQDPDDDNDGWSDTAEIVCGTSPYNSSEVCAEGDVDISTPGDDDLFGIDGDDAGMLAPPPPSSNTNFSNGNCSLNPGATARTAWPILLILTCFTMPIVLNLRTRKRK